MHRNQLGVPSHQGKLFNRSFKFGEVIVMFSNYHPDVNVESGKLSPVISIKNVIALDKVVFPESQSVNLRKTS